MFGIKPRLDLMLSIKVLRPSVGRWSIVEKNRSWEDFDRCNADAMRTVRVGWRMHRCWVVAYKDHVDGFAALVAYGAVAAGKEYTYLSFHLYTADPRTPESFRTSTMLGGGLTIPRRLPRAYKEAIAQDTMSPTT